MLFRCIYFYRNNYSCTPPIFFYQHDSSGKLANLTFAFILVQSKILVDRRPFTDLNLIMQSCIKMDILWCLFRIRITDYLWKSSVKDQSLIRQLSKHSVFTMDWCERTVQRFNLPALMEQWHIYLN